MSIAIWCAPFAVIAALIAADVLRDIRQQRREDRMTAELEQMLREQP